MKWSSIVRGRRARKKGVKLHPLDAADPVEVDFRVLDGTDHAAVVTYAADFAKSSGSPAKDGETAYEFGKAVKTLHLAVTDPESAEDKPEPFFASPTEVLQALDADRIMALAFQHRFFQDTTSPMRHALTDDEFAGLVVALAAEQEGDEDPFVMLRPALLKDFMRSLASRLLSSLELNSRTSSSVEPGSSAD